jgi:rare lipoprotein A
MLGRRGESTRRIRPILGGLMLVAGVAMLAACTAQSPNEERLSSADYGVGASPQVVAYGEPVPKGGGRYLVGEPYRIAGHTYVPHDYSSYSAVGLASWYGRGFHGRRTANGEVYDVADLTAAHPTLPLPSYARVTNLANGRSVMVRINDRGPFRRDRLIDVSASVAKLLGFDRAGTTRVKVDYVGPARMDGLDRKILLASYRGSKAAHDDISVAASKPATPSVILASASAKPPQAQPAADFSGADVPILLTPASSEADLSRAFAPTGKQPKALAPLALRTSFASSYASGGGLSDAEAAASRLAATPAAGERVVQLGVFADPTNAGRIADAFRRFGRIELADLSVEGRALHSVRLVIEDQKLATAAVISAAAAAGLSGARLTAN